MNIKSVLITTISASLLLAGASIAGAQDTPADPTVPGDQSAQIAPGRFGGPRGEGRGGQFGGPRGHFRAAARHHLGEAVAEATGLTIEEVRAALVDGATIADLLTEHGVDVQGFIDAQVAAIDARLDEAVANERITQERADEMLANATERLTNIVNGVYQQDAPAAEADANT